MIEPQRETVRRHVRPLFRRVHRDVSMAPETVRQGVRGSDLIVAGAWLGLIAGLLEIAAILIQQFVHPFITPESLRTNHHFIWMILVPGEPPIEAVSGIAEIGVRDKASGGITGVGQVFREGQILRVEGRMDTGREFVRPSPGEQARVRRQGPR